MERFDSQGRRNGVGKLKDTKHRATSQSHKIIFSIDHFPTGHISFWLEITEWGWQRAAD
jgi:hypothetical protein